MMIEVRKNAYLPDLLQKLDLTKSQKIMLENEDYLDP